MSDSTNDIASIQAKLQAMDIKLEYAASSLAISIRSLAQAQRCASIAVLAMMKSNHDDAFKQLSELNNYLRDAEIYGDNAAKSLTGSINED